MVAGKSIGTIIPFFCLRCLPADGNCSVKKEFEDQIEILDKCIKLLRQILVTDSDRINY